MLLHEVALEAKIKFLANINIDPSLFLGMKASRVTLMLIGDNGCGKTCLLMVFRGDQCPPYYIPKVWIDCVKEQNIDDENIEVHVFDSRSHEDHDKLRTLCYPAVNLVIISYSIDSQTTFENVRKRWLPEVNQYAPQIPVVLVGLKKDLRDNGSTGTDTDEEALVSEAQGHKMKSEIGALEFFECSALKNEGVHKLFETVARIALAEKRTQRASRCFVL